MLSDKQLLDLHEEGFIPGPEEAEEAFLKRVEQAKKFFLAPHEFIGSEKWIEELKKVKKARFQWVRSRLMQLFDLSSEYLSAFYSNKGLSFFQGAATWIVDEEKRAFSFIQLREAFEKGSYLRIYSLEETLAHEFVHMARSAFDEPYFEEFFAYLTSSYSLRKILGPIIKKSREAWVFFSLLMAFMFFSFSSYEKLHFLFLYLLVSWSFLGIFRLSVLRTIFFLSFRKLKKVLKSKEDALAVLFRLKDREIFLLSRLPKKEVLSYFSSRKEETLRHRLIWLRYFSVN